MPLTLGGQNLSFNFKFKMNDVIFDFLLIVKQYDIILTLVWYNLTARCVDVMFVEAIRGILI